MAAARAGAGGGMNNAERIVFTLDEQLDHEVSLVVYGRAAIALGFENPPVDVMSSLDVDIILSEAQLPSIEADDQFWEALEKTNQLLEVDGLYVTHLFLENQVFLRPSWRNHTVPITRPALDHLKLHRPDTIDLVLTKMMRGADPTDRTDLEFLIQQAKPSVPEMEVAIKEAMIPDVPELRELFSRAKPIVMQLAAQYSES